MDEITLKVSWLDAGALVRKRVRTLLDSVGAEYVEDRGFLGSIFRAVRFTTTTPIAVAFCETLELYTGEPVMSPSSREMLRARLAALR